MDEALEAAKNHILEYHDAHQMVEIEEGNVTLAALPLVAVPKGKKSIKEFFQIVPGISLDDREAIAAAYTGGFNLATLPPSVRPRDSLGESIKLQIVMEEGSDGSCNALKFFHSGVDIPIGLARTMIQS